MPVYIHQLRDWPQFTWQQDQLAGLLAQTRYRQGKLLGKMESLGFNLRTEASLETLTLDVLKSSEIEGELLDAGQVRSSIARRLGLDIAGLVQSDRHVDGTVDVMLDATQQYQHRLSAERLFGWHAALFPTGRSRMHKIVVGNWRDNSLDDPMQVVSGPAGKEKVHFLAPAADRIAREMDQFMNWFNGDSDMDEVCKAAIAHLWFVTIHPFDDGNGRIARSIADMQLARAEQTSFRFYSMSAQIRKERKDYYDILESTQKDKLDVTPWLLWFIQCLDRAIAETEILHAGIIRKAKFWEKHASASLNERQRIMVNKLLDGFEGKLNSSKWAKITKTSQDTALRDIQDLLARQILEKETGGGRSTAYILSS